MGSLDRLIAIFEHRGLCRFAVHTARGRGRGHSAVASCTSENGIRAHFVAALFPYLRFVGHALQILNCHELQWEMLLSSAARTNHASLGSIQAYHCTVILRNVHGSSSKQ